MTSVQNFVIKIESKRLAKEKWDIRLPLSEAKKNGEVVTLGESQMLRWLCQINGLTDRNAEVMSLKNELKELKKRRNGAKNRRKIGEIYEKLDQLQYQRDYVLVVMNTAAHYKKLANSGFMLNGVKYVRLLGTAGGVKTRTIIFVSDIVYDRIWTKIENNRDTTIPITPGKLDSYRALTCSVSSPVSMPNGIAIVRDVETSFKANVVKLSNENSDEPVMEYVEEEDVTLCASDGMGLMTPELAARWASELGLDYTPGGYNLRYAWTKGMAFTFPILEYADKVAGTRIIEDIYGNKVDLTNVELILTESQVKLWNSYKDTDDFIENCINNGYDICVAKIAPKELENERALNYQFIQGYTDLTDDEIQELISPTVNEIKDILSLSPEKAILFLHGDGVCDTNPESIPNTYEKAIMVDGRIHKDPYVVGKINKLINKKINNAKIGVLRSPGNYSIIAGDPITLMEGIFKMPPKGLLQAGEFYSKYWFEKGVERIACFRAPMTCHESALVRTVSKNKEALHWYRYMTTITITNSHDTSCHALNGADFDSDTIYTTNNRILVERHRDLPAILCAQKKATKIIPTQKDIVASNIKVFGSSVGQITNRATSRFDLLEKFDKDSREHKTLLYRISCGQLLQQDTLDAVKGIVAKPEPKTWYNRKAIAESDMTDDEKEFQMSICADKKPYFMQFIYPALHKSYKDYVRNTNMKSIFLFKKDVSELKETPEHELSEDEKIFLRNYEKYNPVTEYPCVMNRICWAVSEELDRYISKTRATLSLITR